MFFDKYFQTIQQFLAQFVPGYVLIKTYRFFNKEKSHSFEGTAIASVAISYILNLVANLFVKNNDAHQWILGVAAVIMAFVCALLIVKIKTFSWFKNCLTWIGKISDSNNIWEELFDRNHGSSIRCYSRFNNEDVMIEGIIAYYDVREDGECDIGVAEYVVTYGNGNQYSVKGHSSKPVLYLNSRNLHGLEVVKGESKKH